AAAAWAREGVPIDTIHHAIHEGFKIGFDLVVTNATTKTRTTTNGSDGTGSAGNGGDGEPTLTLTHTDYTNLLQGAKLLVEILDTMTTAVSHAYVRELRAVV
ncbi:hypothetical protein IU505_35095, partial [Nocardia nova]|nr:hypothetical protein [Nocardia nova]